MYSYVSGTVVNASQPLFSYRSLLLVLLMLYSAVIWFLYCMLLLYDYDVVLQPLFKVQAQQQSIASLTTAQYNDLLTYFNEREMKVSVLCQQSFISILMSNAYLRWLNTLIYYWLNLWRNVFETWCSSNETDIIHQTCN